MANLAKDFVTATYNLEGNVPLMFTGEEELLKVQNLASDFGSLLKDTVRTELASRSMVNVTNTDYWTVEMDGGVRPMMAYFSSRFVTGLGTKSGLSVRRTQNALHAARLGDPLFPGHPLELDPLRVRLRLFPNLTNNHIDCLVEEYGKYRGLATQHPPPVSATEAVNIQTRGLSIMKWWGEHALELPNWSLFARLIATLQPSSAASERIFSIVDFL